MCEQRRIYLRSTGFCSSPCLNSARLHSMATRARASHVGEFLSYSASTHTHRHRHTHTHTHTHTGLQHYLTPQTHRQQLLEIQRKNKSANNRLSSTVSFSAYSPVAYACKMVTGTERPILSQQSQEFVRFIECESLSAKRHNEIKQVFVGWRLSVN